MINRTFNRKYKRTYLGGSKQEETRRFLEVQGTKEDNSECDWLKYGRMLSDYLDDRLNVLLSWKEVMKIGAMVFAVITVLVTTINVVAAGVFFGIALLFKLIEWRMKKTEVVWLGEYRFSLEIINENAGIPMLFT